MLETMDQNLSNFFAWQLHLQEFFHWRSLILACEQIEELQMLWFLYFILFNLEQEKLLHSAVTVGNWLCCQSLYRQRNIQPILGRIR